MSELKEILSALLVLSGQLASGVPWWVTAPAAAGIAVALFAGIARQAMAQEVGEFTRCLRRGASAFGSWLGARPEQLFVGLDHVFLRRLMAIDVIVLGTLLGFQLLPPLWTVSQVLALPNHPRFLWAGPVFTLECGLLLLCARLVRVGWKNLAQSKPSCARQTALGAS